MPITATIQSNTKAGSCPHGLPSGACPICSGMAGGNSTTKRNTPRNKGEMTYNQCLAAWNMIKAQKRAKKEAMEQEAKHILILDFRKALENSHNKILQFGMNISGENPSFLAKTGAFLLSNLIAKPIKFLADLPEIFSKGLNYIKENLSDVASKITSVIGEIKASIEKKVSEFLSEFKKKIKSLFSIFAPFEADDEERKVEEAKKAFNLKTFIHKLINRNKKGNKK